MAELSATQKADAYDQIIRQIRNLEPSIARILADNGRSSGWKKADEVTRLFGAFKTLIDENKRLAMGDAKLLARLRSGI